MMTVEEMRLVIVARRMLAMPWAYTTEELAATVADIRKMERSA